MFKKRNIELSFIIAAKNASSHIDKLIYSLKDCKKIRACEVIFVVDSSTDDTLDKIFKLINDVDLADISKCFSVNYGNPGSSRNFGASKAQGEWLVFLDADDLPAITLYEKLINEASEEIEILVGQYSIVSASNGSNLRKSNDKCANEIALNPGVWRMILRKRLIDKASFSELSLGEDHNFLSNIGFESRNVKYFSENIYTYYKKVEGQLTSNRNKYKDLRKAISLNILNYKNDGNSFLRIMIVKEFITYLRIAPFLEKFSYLIKGIKFLYNLRSAEVFLFLNCFIYVLKHKSSKKSWNQ